MAEPYPLLAGNGYKNLLILALIKFRSPPGSGHRPNRVPYGGYRPR